VSYFAEIYIMNADGSDERRLTDWPGYDGGPFFTPDGKRIVLAALRRKRDARRRLYDASRRFRPAAAY